VRSNGLAVLTPFNLCNNTVDRATLLADLCIVPSRPWCHLGRNPRQQRQMT